MQNANANLGGAAAAGGSNFDPDASWRMPPGAGWEGAAGFGAPDKEQQHDPLAEMLAAQ